jgi:serine/threonine-protein kinase Chk2
MTSTIVMQKDPPSWSHLLETPVGLMSLPRLPIESPVAHASAICVGKGGHAEVWRVRDTKNHVYAEKRFPLDKEQLILHERSCYERIPAHPHILRYRQFHRTSEYVSLRFDYCSGGDLFEYVRQSRPGHEKVKAGIIRQVTCALHHIHRQKIIHRDVKIENILLSRPAESESYMPHVYLSDFGCALKMDEEEPELEHAGTLSIASPEQLSMKPLTPAVDAWALGILTYTLLARCHPFDERGKGKPDDLRRRIMTYEWKFHRFLFRHVSKAAQDFISRLICPLDERMTIDEALHHPWLNSITHSFCLPC